MRPNNEQNFHSRIFGLFHYVLKALIFWQEKPDYIKINDHVLFKGTQQRHSNKTVEIFKNILI